jgi:pyruvate/2-oxoglutarate dehydrogenase complex dihydrolipoamide dehydrogenase (E3) component
MADSFDYDLVIVGAGAIGIEFSHIMNSFGMEAAPVPRKGG